MTQPITDARAIVQAQLDALKPEPVTPEMSESEIEAARRRVVYRLLGAK